MRKYQVQCEDEDEYGRKIWSTVSTHDTYEAATQEATELNNYSHEHDWPRHRVQRVELCEVASE